MTRLAAAAASALLLFAAAPCRAEDGEGSWEDPHRVDGFPYAHGADTTTGVEGVDWYGCAPDLDESGPEVVYSFLLDRPGRVTAWVEGDAAGSVDIDVHVLDALPTFDGSAGCLARGNVVAEADMAAGEGWVSVDSFVEGGLALSGPFVLRLDFVPEGEPREREVARGVRWRMELHRDLFGGAQTVNVLDVDLAAPGVTVAPALGDGCETTSGLAERLGAVAAVNAGFFGPGCEPVGLVRVGDELLARNPADRPPRSVLGLGRGLAVVRTAAAGDGVDEVPNALGGLPGLVRDGAAEVAWREESAGEAFSTDRHPRTAACVTGDDHLILVTFDGRTSAGLGVDLYDLADYLVGLGCDRGLNYDGGGSTTMWVAPPAGYGVVSYPSDNGLADHRGERAVSTGWLLWAEPTNRPPRFTTEPPLEAEAGARYLYDADALDLDLDPVTFSLVAGPSGMAVDPASGLVSWTPGAVGPAEVTVVLGAGDGAAVTEQPFELAVAGVVEPPADGDADADGDGDAEADVAADADARGASGEVGPPSTGSGGCACRGAAALPSLGRLARLFP